ncbi:TIGR01244 family sulfur transferase [Niveispirillum irakense]|uniref:TIGR01244 family sulfur transferase n=1 Tax=Niveispirillum irakense TaxID=34011 RepID=UPI00054F9458|nr:TIGR01244 family sulfur transferase [Niveispirillum irakense]
MTLDIRPLVDGIAVAPQIDAVDLPAIKAAGYKTIINNRPDGEEPGQLSAAEAASLASDLGLTYIYLPVTSPTLGQKVGDFAAALAASPGPVLAHCRSGTRSTILWALAEAKAGSTSEEAILRTAAQAGYDLSTHAQMIRQYRQAGR